MSVIKKLENRETEKIWKAFHRKLKRFNEKPKIIKKYWSMR